MSKKSPKLTLLVIGKVWPEPDSSAAGSRILQIVQLFQEDGYEITFASGAGKSPFSFDLKSIGIKEQEIVINDSGFDAYVQSLQPDVVLFDRFSTEEQFGWRVAESCPEALRLLDTEDLHCLREGRRIALKAQRDFQLTDLNNEIAKREIASILRCDLTLMISEVEINYLTKHFRIDRGLLVYIPFLTPKISVSSWTQHDDRKHFISIGNFLHEPNWDAVLFLKNTIWPKIRSKLPNAELHIYGAYPSQKVLQLHNEKEGFLIKGRAENALGTISNYRVLLAPLRFGAGLKGKLLDAMLTGTPSVTSTVGAEGMNGTFDWPGVIADQPDKFAEYAVQLHENEETWKIAQSNIQPLLEGRFGPQHAGNFIESVRRVRENLNQHRSQNFFGQMIMHHSLASTKFMSKWIEAKNKHKESDR